MIMLVGISILQPNQERWMTLKLNRLQFLKTLSMLLLTPFTILSGGQKKDGQYNSSVENKKTTNPIRVVASWYGGKFVGRPTASGEIYDSTKLTVAHKTLKFGTILRLTNPQNGRSLIVRVNDRGPYWVGRDLDVSEAVALHLGFHHKGVTELLMEKLSS